MRRSAARIAPLALAAIALVHACGKRRAAEPASSAETRGPASRPSPGVTAAPAPPAAVRSHVAGPAAFDLALMEDGALLAWSPPRSEGGGLFVQRLDAQGVPRAAALRLAQTDAGGEVIELAASGLGTRAGVAWIESSDDESRTRALLWTPEEAAPPEPTRLQTAEGKLAPGHRRLAVGGGRGGRLRVLFATPAQDCGQGRSEPCTAYAFREIGDGAPSGRGGEWLRVPEPCAGVAPLVGGAGSALYYAVCAETDGARATTAYGIEMQTEYAHAVRVLSGCTPLALLAPVQEGAWIVGRCDGARRAAEISTDATRPAREHALDGLEVVCADGEVTLRAGDLDLPLRAPLDGLEAILPPSLAPDGSSAVFTGRAILTVRARDGELALGRHGCEQGRLTATDK